MVSIVHSNNMNILSLNFKNQFVLRKHILPCYPKSVLKKKHHIKWTQLEIMQTNYNQQLQGISTRSKYNAEQWQRAYKRSRRMRDREVEGRDED